MISSNSPSTLLHTGHYSKLSRNSQGDRVISTQKWALVSFSVSPYTQISPWHPCMTELIAVIFTWMASCWSISIISQDSCCCPVRQTYIGRCCAHVLGKDAERSAEVNGFTPDHISWDDRARAVNHRSFHQFSGTLSSKSYSFICARPVLSQIPSWCHSRKIGKPKLCLTIK